MDPSRALAPVLPAGSRPVPVATRDGLMLRCLGWRRAGARGRVTLLQGRAEAVEKYAHIVQGLLERNLDVVAFDWRGQGASPRAVRRHDVGHVGHFQEYLDDLESVLTQCPPGQTSPHFVVAHSMGGCIALRLLVNKAPLFGDLRHLWLSAPMMGFRTDPLPNGLARLLARVACGLGLAKRAVPWSENPYGEFAGNRLTSDRRRFEALRALAEARPDLVIDGVTFGWVRAAFEAIDWFKEPGRLEGIGVPTTVFLGSDERVVDPRAVERAAARLAHATLVRLPGARHEVFMERDQLLARFWQGVDAQLAALPGRRE